MENRVGDQPGLNYIQRLIAEEQRLYQRALRDVGLDPDDAQVRPPQVVEYYEQ